MKQAQKLMRVLTLGILLSLLATSWVSARGAVTSRTMMIPVNDPPNAVDDSAETDVGMAVDVAVLINDSDPDGDELTIVETSNPANGSVEINADGALTYTPDAGFSGEDSFTYTISDGEETDTATVNIVVLGASVSLLKSGPAQAHESDSVTYDFTIVNDGGSVLEDVTLTDPLLGGEISECAVAELGFGESVTCQATYDVPVGAVDPLINTATVVGNYSEDETTCEFGGECFQYEFLGAITNEDGSVTLRFELTNECGNATALSNVAFGLPDGVVPVNPTDGDTSTAPSGNEYNVESPTNNPFYSIKFETNAEDGIRDGASDIFEYTLPAGTYDPSQEIQIEAKGGGTVETVTFTPETCVDSGSGGSVSDSDTHSVDILYPPVAVDDTETTDEDVVVDIDVLANDSDPDGDALSIIGTTDPANGSITVNADGTIIYMPDADFNGEDSFTYTISDGNGGEATATVTVTVTPVNDPPVAEDDNAETNKNEATTIVVLDNDSDPESDGLTITTTSSPANGDVTLNDDDTITYTPDFGFSGEDSFTYTISDGNGGEDTATVIVNVINGSPTAEDDTGSTDKGKATNIAVLDNDSDPDDDNLTITATSEPGDGSVTVNDDGTVTYTPDPGFLGEDSFTYTISDGVATGTATVTVNVSDATMICAAYSDNFNDGIVDSRWTSIDINSKGVGDPLGSTSESDGRLIISSDGSEIFYGDDDFRFVYQQVPENFDVTVQVAAAMLDANQWSKAGLMVRESLEPDAERVMVHFTRDNAVQFAYRKDGESDRFYPDTDVAGLPVWIGLERDGDLYFASYSTDGVNWMEVGWIDVDLGDTPYVGLSVASYEDDTEQSAEFENFTLCQYDYPDPPEPPDVGDEPTITTTQMITSEVCGAADIALSVEGQGEITTYHKPVDLMIVLDNSGSMDDAGQNPDQPLLDAKDAAKILIDQLDAAYDRVGLVSYAHNANFDYPLSTRYDAVKGAIDNLDANGYTNVGDAIYEAREALVAYGRNDAVPVIVILSDGVANRSHDNDTCELEPITNTVCTEDAVAQAEAAKDLDITVYAIGLNLGGVGNAATEEIARATLEAMASASAYYEAPDSSDLAGIYEEIAEDVINVAAYDTRIIASLPAGVDYRAGSASLEPSEIITDGDNTTLTWNVGIVPISKTRTVSFSVEVELAGESTLLNAYPETRVEYRDAQDTLQQMDFPNAEMAIEIVPCNLPPVAEDDTAETNENTAIDIDVLVNDSDPDGDGLSIVGTTEPANGSVTVNDDGITYTPDAGYNGEDSFTYTISDRNGGEDTATVTITVIEVEDIRPILECVVDNRDGTYTAYFGYLNGNDFPVSIEVGDRNKFSPTPQDRGQPTTFESGRTSYWPDAAFNVDFDGNNLVWTLDGRTATASRNSTPCSNHVFFEKEWQDEKGNSLSELPTGLPSDFSITAESELGTVICSYPEEGTKLECVYDNDAPALDDKGLWVPVGSVYTVTETRLPDRWAADDGVGTFTVNDGYCQAGLEGMSKYCEHTVVNAYNPNHPPEAVDDSETTDEDTPVTVEVLANDSDPDGDDLSIIGTTEPASGSITLNDDGTITYTPDADFSGEDSFTYTISDGNGGEDTATVTITVIPVNDPPVAVDDSETTDEDTPVTVAVLTNDSDPDGDALSVIGTTDPANGSITVNADGTITYTPDADFSGEDSFTYTISDGNGGEDTATVTITVIPVNDPPVAVDDSETTDEDTPVTVDVLANDSDPDGDDLSLIGTTDPANGSLTVNADGTITYTPDADFSGEDSFTYTISDGNGGEAIATVTITVIPVNDPPVAVDDSETTDEDTPVTVDVLANDSDPDGDDLSIIGTTDPANGSLTVNADGTITYTPDAGFSGEDSFTYTISDGNGGEDTATVTITVIPAPGDSAILIQKEISLGEGGSGEFYAGATVNFYIYLENIGEEDLTDVMVVDALAPECDNAIGDLATGAATGYVCAVSDVTESFTNTATASGIGPAGNTVEDTDTAYVEILPLNPAISIQKLIGGEGTGTIPVGGDVTFQIIVENVGDVALTDVEVTDALVPACDDVFEGEFAPGDTFSYACVVENVTQSFTNSATAEGFDPLGNSVADTDTAAVQVEQGGDDGGDSDDDGAPGYQDPDSDGDGIPDSVEAGDDPVDTDGDGMPDYQDTDSDGDGIPDSVEAGDDPTDPGDTDGDGTPDYQDTDSDGDGIPDSVEAGDNPTDPVDTDNDGTPDYQDPDSDGDGIPDSVEAGDDPTDPVDTDGDGMPDYQDTDSDGDGIPDSVEAGDNPTDPVDTDGDGTPDYQDTDSDGDGIPDSVEAGDNPTDPVDTDNDGTPDYQDADSDGDGIPDSVEAGDNPTDPVDTDNDGAPDYQDADSDGDGIPDSVEAGDNPTDPVDTDGDGAPDYQDTDSDGDGIPDSVEAGDNPADPVDTDGDGLPDYRDLDSDGDGIPDSVEAGDDPTDPVDTDNDGTPDYRDLDSDGDGLLDTQEWSAGSEDPLGDCSSGAPICFNNDADGDGQPNYLDLDSDSDGIPDAVEYVGDADNDGMPDVDADGDGIPNHLDLDSDDDGVLDETEGTGDENGNGIPNYLDPEISDDTEFNHKFYLPMILGAPE